MQGIPEATCLSPDPTLQRLSKEVWRGAVTFLSKLIIINIYETRARSGHLFNCFIYLTLTLQERNDHPHFLDEYIQILIVWKLNITELNFKPRWN